MRYIFDDLRGVKEKLKGKYLFLFLDCDGTLAPIADTPEKAAIPQKIRKVLALLSKKNNCKVAVISGRELSGVKRMVGLKDVIYSGNHGFQIEGPKIKYQLAVPSGYKKILQVIKSRLKKKLSGIKGVLIEDKKLFLALHFRLADEKDNSFIKAVFYKSILSDLEKKKVKAKAGKKVFEVGPPVGWDKGKVVLWLLARREFICSGKSLLPVYIGDDLTDEDAFKALEGKGLTVFVGAAGNSGADYYLKDTREVAEFLRLISNLKVD
jgi:trehalose-phosphatase